MPRNWRSTRRIPTAKQFRVRFNQLRADLIMPLRKRTHRKAARATGPARAGFVAGCPRSGTTMVLYALDKSLDVDRYAENHRAAFVDCRIEGKPVRDRLLLGSSAKRVIFKPVCDSHRVAELLSAHECARAVWVYRDYRDVANSAVQRWGKMNRDWVQELARGRGDWGRRQWNRELITPERQEEVEAFCDEDLTPYGAAAIFWYLVNCTFFDQRLADTSNITITRYEDIVTRPRSEFQRLCGFFGITFSDEMVDKIFSPSLQKRQSDLPIAPRIADACEEVLERLEKVTAALH